MSNRQVIHQDGRERYRIVRGEYLPGVYSAMVGAFVYDPATENVVLDTWASKDFPTPEARQAWIEEVTR